MPATPQSTFDSASPLRRLESDLAANLRLIPSHLNAILKTPPHPPQPAANHNPTPPNHSNPVYQTHRTAPSTAQAIHAHPSHNRHP